MATTAPQYTVRYRILNSDLSDPERTVEVHATPGEIAQFARDGFLVRERVVSGDRLERLRSALDEVIAAERGGASVTGKAFGGLFLRHLMDKHEAFLDLLRFPPTLSIVRAMLGPQVQVRGVSARVTYPGEANQETQWHFHQRVVPVPVPPFFSPPQTIEALLYLDDANDVNGPFCVVPGSHRRITENIEALDFADKPGQLVLRVPAGSVIFAHGSLWHRGMPMTPHGTVRRLLIIGYGPTWMRPSIYGTKPENGLTEHLLAAPDADAETRELLGQGGYM